ncbi:MAG: glycosyltransferase family 2 protein [Pyrinomonadaceae bacterium]
MYIFYFLGMIALWFGVQSLLSGLRYRVYVNREIKRELPPFTPFVSVIAPTRGLDDELAENVRALFEQEYPCYEIVFVFDRTDDPAIKTINDVGKTQKTKHEILIAGPAVTDGQKVHNLRVAADKISDASEVLVFADTDARPTREWLRHLVAPLADENIGAATGYRWFVPFSGGLPSRLRAIWNASVASALGQNERKNFCWGGATAIARSVFERLRVVDQWQGTVSDDFTLTRVLQEAGLLIHFTPACLTPSIGDCGFRELLEFTTRQLKITRVYAPHLWRGVLFGGSLFVFVFFGGLILVGVRLLLGLHVAIVIVVLSSMFLLGAAKSYVRWMAVRSALPEYRTPLLNDLPAQLLLWPFASLLYLYNAIAAGFSRRIQWRGITYELKSPTRAVIISRDLDGLRKRSATRI